jgi:hypothetical protein
MGTLRQIMEPKAFENSGPVLLTSSLSYLLRHAGDRFHVPEAVTVPVAAAATAILFNLAIKAHIRYVSPKLELLRSSIRPKAEQLQSSCMRLLRRERHEEDRQLRLYT